MFWRKNWREEILATKIESEIRREDARRSCKSNASKKGKSKSKRSSKIKRSLFPPHLIAIALRSSTASISTPLYLSFLASACHRSIEIDHGVRQARRLRLCLWRRRSVPSGPCNAPVRRDLVPMPNDSHKGLHDTPPLH